MVQSAPSHTRMTGHGRGDPWARAPPCSPVSALSPEVYKLLYASRLADCGLPAQALQYCEQIATALLGQDLASHSVLAQQVMKVSLVPSCILGGARYPLRTP